MYINYRISFGAGTTASDYTSTGDIRGNNVSLSYLVPFPAGVSELTGTIHATINSVGAEGDNTVTFRLQGSSDYVVGTSSSTTTILANDLEVINANDSGDGSLRQAILNADSFGGSNTIPVNTSGTITLGSDLPSITGTLIINGPGADLLTVNGANNYRPFTVDSSADLTLDGLTIANGKSTTNGGGISNSGTLTLTNSTLDGNSAPYGGGIATSGTATVSSSTFTDNQATGVFGGGGIYNQGLGALIVINSTFSGNSSPSGGGGLRNTGVTVAITNSTFYGNSASAGGGVSNGGGLHLYNTIIAGSTSGSDCSYTSGSLSLQYTLIADGSCSIPDGVNGNLTGDPDLGTLTGSPAYYPLNAGSLAINAGDNALAVDADNNSLTTDEAGSARVVAGIVDMGASELVYTPDFVVDRTDDLNIAACTTAANDCTLRGAITLANAIAGAETITFADDYTITLAGSSLPDVTSEMIIDGTGAANTIVQASSCNPVTLPGGCTPATYRVMLVTNTGDLTLNNLTVQYGAASGDGGGLYNNGALTLTNAVLASNSASGYGGGLFVNGGTLVLSNTTVSDNRSVGDGGGIETNGGTLTLTDCTLTGNQTSTSNSGGGLDNYLATTTVTNCTFTGNSAYAGWWHYELEQQHTDGD